MTKNLEKEMSKLAYIYGKKLVAAMLNAGAAPEKEEETTDKPKKHGWRKSKSTFVVEEKKLFVREYSEKSWVIYGDTKPLADLFKTMREAASEKKNIIGYVGGFSVIDGNPCGWRFDKEYVESAGGIGKIIAALTEAGYDVSMLESVAALKAEHDRAKGKKSGGKQSVKVEEPKAEAEPKAEKKSGKKIAVKPKASAAPAPSAPKSEPKTFKMLCYEPAKTEDGYTVTERELQKRGSYYYLQGGKGAMVYAHIGNDCETDAAIAVMIAKVAGDISKTIVAAAKDWEEIAKTGVYESFKAGKLKAMVHMAHAYCCLGDNQDVVTELWTAC